MGTEIAGRPELKRPLNPLALAVNCLFVPTTSTREIAALDAALRAEVVRVRWDRSGRSHKDALDSYRPQGWEWDRIYPDVWSSPEMGRDVPLPAKSRLALESRVAIVLLF